MSKKKFAVFDIDGTLYRYALHHAVIDQLMNVYFSKEITEFIEKERKNWKNRTHNDVFWDFADSQNKAFFGQLHAIDPESFEKAARKVVEEQKQHVYSYTAELFKKLKNEGRVMIAISGSAEEVVKPFCEYWGFNIIRAQKFERIDGKYTGNRHTTHDDKHLILEQIINEYDLDKSDSISIGDTFYDIPLLSSVTTPIAFNPDYKLLEHARKMGWKIVVERKNSIYELGKENDKYILA